MLVYVKSVIILLKNVIKTAKVCSLVILCPERIKDAIKLTDVCCFKCHQNCQGLHLQFVEHLSEGVALKVLKIDIKTAKVW